MAAARAAGGRRHQEAEASAAAGSPVVAGAPVTDGDLGLPRPAQARARVVVEGVRPQVDGGRWPAKATLGEDVVVEADVFADGHDLLAVELRYRPAGGEWSSASMAPLGNDRWRGAFPVHQLGHHQFALRAGVDRFATWRRAVAAKAADGQDVTVELAVGAGLVQKAAGRAKGADRALLGAVAEALLGAERGLESDVRHPELVALISAPPAADGRPGALAELVAAHGLAALLARYRDPAGLVTSTSFPVWVDPERARFSAWYELFPRSASPDPERPGTLADVEARLDYVARLGFDVVYLPPIHPIGTTNRKGRDGAPVAGPLDPGSPWAIGSADGGHTAVHPSLGTVADLEHLVAAARSRGIEVALDFAIQCSPDHPWVTEHPEWFAHLPDGTIRFAENPPKRYEDIYPVEFDTPAWAELWQALADVVEFWIARGVRIFRVDNPHTKPFAFWQWLIEGVKARHPEVLFLSEAFTRPRVMERLAKLGFSQSYTYFAWRSSAWELQTYLTELTASPVADFLRPNLWPNTPDILTEELQTGGTAAFLARLVLAATLSSSYGIYGPVYELCRHQPRHPGSEEYADSEKYAVAHWDLDDPSSLADFVTRVNRIRHENPALHHNRTLRFHRSDNEQLLVYSKSFLVEEPRDLGRPPAHEPRDPNVVLVVVSLDHAFPQSGWIDLDLEALGLEPDADYEVHDLLTDARFHWHGARNFVMLDPEVVPAHVLRVHRPAEQSRNEA